ncbi:MAG: GTPase ObgE [Alistipes sp.]|nr:GTPase ObgE [Rikenellaceae bacterium]MBO5189055.1 GTPase ObgE [Alistipes sp.]
MAGSNFVDYVKIFARSGHGGAGSAHFRREKFVAFGGPDGGDGGKGGSIILQGDRQYWTLIHLKYQRHQFAEDGECGSGARASGKNAKDIIIPVPLGTVARRLVENEETGETELVPVGEVTEDGEQLVLLQGGRGGLGNWHFKSATNQTPRYAQPGEEGDEGAFVLELKVLADVGLVGFPNAGKSTLLSVVSAAKPKIANYAFTTLEPNLGIVEVRDRKSFVMADIPGIIEGAHEGRGLGTRFLRHIERNSVLLFMIPADSDDVKKDYEILLGELTQYNPELLDKQRLLAITKCDMLDEELMEEMRGDLPEGVPAVFISSVTGLHIQQLKDMLWAALQEE